MKSVYIMQRVHLQKNGVYTQLSDTKFNLIKKKLKKRKGLLWHSFSYLGAGRINC